MTHKDSKTLPWFQPILGKEEEEGVIAVIRSGFINDGPVTKEFERRIAELVGVKHCVAVTSGTAAIALSLMGLGIKPGDEVIVPDLTFVATANAVRLAGATVKLVDIEPHRFGVDVSKVEKAINSRTRAIVTVDVNGRGADYGQLEPLAHARGLYLVCDSAEGLGSRYCGKPIGSFGNAACFSFSPNKLLTTGQGGMVATNDKVLYDRLLELKDQGRRQRGTGGDDLHPVLGYNFKFTDVQAAIGLAQLAKLTKRCQLADERDRWYREALAEVPGVTIPDQDKPEDGEVRAWMDVLVSDRQRAREALDRAGIGCRAFWFPLHTQGPYCQNNHEYPIATSISERGLWLPSVFDITEPDIRRVADVLRKTLDK